MGEDGCISVIGSFSTLIKDAGNSSNVSASTDIADSWGKGSRVTYSPFLVLPLATATRLCDGLKIGNFSLILSASLT